jgi:allantoinase
VSRRVEASAPLCWRIPYWTRHERPRLEWPCGARLAVWIVPNLEYYEYQPPRYDFRDQFPRAPHPDVMQYSFRDYGNRIGVWRMADALADYPIRVTASTNLAVFDHCPEIAALVRERRWCVMSHGIYNTRYLGRGTAEEEREFYRASIAATRHHTGQTLQGMLGPCVTNGPSTPELMCEAGLRYHADWVHDDVPVPLESDAGRLVTVPYNYEINDAPMLEGHFDGPSFVRFNIDQFDRLYAEGARSPGVFCVALHPYLIGQPHMIGHLRRLLDHVCSRGDIWHATGDEIAAAAWRQYWPESTA